jgi:hypothetical protein
MSRRRAGTPAALVAALAAALVASVAVVACGTSGGDRGAFDEDAGGAGAEAGAAPANAASGDGGGATSADGAGGSPGVGYPDGGCSPLTCKDGCCSNDGTCLPGTAPAQCGKGGLVCVACSAIGYGCVSQGCSATATCTNCDGCCKAGTCNPNGKTQDNACGHGGAVCTDCTSSGRTCDGNGSCH